MSIPISKEHGIDPHLTYCTNCGGDVNAITLGTLMCGEDDKGMKHYYNAGRKPKGVTIYHSKRVPSHEKVPFGLCDDCEKEQTQFSEASAKGGVYFRCESCGINGVVQYTKSSHGFCKEVRTLNDLVLRDDETNKPCGVLFDNCERHVEIGIPKAGENH